MANKNRNPFQNKTKTKTKYKTSSFKISHGDLYLCPSCNNYIKYETFYSNYKICPQCGYKERINSDDFIYYYFDFFDETQYQYFSSDPLKFSDSKGKYKDRLLKLKEKYRKNDAIVSGKAFIKDIDFYAALMDFRIFGGSLNIVVGKILVDTIHAAIYEKLPLLIVSQSGGARMHEGLFSLMQMAKVQAALSTLSDLNLPYISFMLDPTTGGVAASYAMVGDINIAEKGAIIGFAGRRVIEQNLGEKLPDDFQTSEFQLKHGFIDIVVKRDDIKKTLYKVIKFFHN